MLLVALPAPSHGLVGVGLAWLAASGIVASATVWHVAAVLRGGTGRPRKTGDYVPPRSAPAAGAAAEPLG